MSIDLVLKEVQTFFNEEICANFTFKRPPSVEGMDTENYDYELVQPQAYLMYPPTKDKLPSVTIQVDEGEVSRNTSSGELKLRFLFGTWSNGRHYINSETGARCFEDNSEGWHDAWNFVDRAIDVLCHTTHFGDKVRIKHEDRIRVGGMKEDNVLANYYPYWFAWVTCTVQYGQISSNEDTNDLI